MRLVELSAPIYDLSGIRLQDYLFKTTISNVEVYEIIVSLAGDIAKIQGLW